MNHRHRLLRPWLAALVIGSAVLLAGGAAASSGVPGTGLVTPDPTSARPSGMPTPVPGLETIPPGAAPIVGEAPASVIAAARADLAGRLSPDAAARATVVRSEAVQWPDGSLGCPVPGEAYPQMVTPGYWIVLAADGHEHDYRATESGSVRLCERAPRPIPSG